ncbi:ABC transporter ATP-binding protein [Acinetobacter baumannii]|uniref:ABC transporter ATP-binding protein n=1 Tax=Acinetobacter baumannii TaxID=470 RepID=UPI003879BBBD
MLRIFNTLLGNDIRYLYRYLCFMVLYGVLCAVMMVILAGILQQLLLGQTQHLLTYLTVFILMIVVSWLWRYQVEQAGIQVGVAIIQETRQRLGNHVASLPIGWFNTHNKGVFQHTVMQGLMAVAQLPAHVFTPVITGIVTASMLAIALYFYYGVLGGIAVLSLIVLGFIFKLTSKISHYADSTFQHNFADASQRIVEFAQAQSVLRAFSGEHDSQHFMQQAIGRQHQASFKLILCSSLSSVLNMWGIQVIFAVLFSVALYQFLPQGQMLVWQDMVSLAVVMLLIYRFIEPLLEVASYYDIMRNAQKQLNIIQNIFATPALAEPTQPKIPADASIILHDVHFRYAPEQKQVLQGIHLEIASGSMLALIGKSGSGKSTLVQLIARFFDVTQGQILIGGVDVRQMSTTQLTSQISQIFQDNYLFAGSIADNIRMGHPDASDAQIMQVIELAGVNEMIARLPQGMDTPVGEGGIGLSGGERQRISIARALLKDAPILLVDEATSALDTEHQAMIATLLAKLKGQRTLVVIAHQLSTIAMADHIAVLDSGKIVEQGTAEQLAQHNGVYRKFLEQQQAVKGWHLSPIVQRQ